MLHVLTSTLVSVAIPWFLAFSDTNKTSKGRRGIITTASMDLSSPTTCDCALAPRTPARPVSVDFKRQKWYTWLNQFTSESKASLQFFRKLTAFGQLSCVSQCTYISCFGFKVLGSRFLISNHLCFGESNTIILETSQLRKTDFIWTDLAYCQKSQKAVYLDRGLHCIA